MTTGTSQSLVDFIHGRIGRNWVIARRTPRVLRQYGDDVVCLSPQRYDRLVDEYERTTLRDAHGTGPARVVVDAALDLLTLARHAARMDVPPDVLQKRARRLVDRIEGRA